jgi:hypothetical protein
VETQVGALLSCFAIPEPEREALIAAWLDQQGRATGHAAEQARLAQKAERLKTLYLEGDLDDEDYRRQSVAVAAALAELPPDDQVTPKRIARRLAAMLADLAGTWDLATPAERNAIARELFYDVVIENRAITAVKPKPDMLPYFAAITARYAGGPGPGGADASQTPVASAPESAR